MPSASTSMSISVVICTKDRPELLDGCLRALRQQRHESYEIVVVDNGSSDDATRLVAERHGARTVREDRVGLDNARNRGAEEAAHEIVAYVDDDVRVEAEWLSALGRAFEDPSVDAVTGLVLPLELETPAQRIFEAYGDGMSKGPEAGTYRGADLSAEALIAVQHIGVGANMAVRKGALMDVDGFDPALDVGTPAGGAGDLDLFHRLLAAGKTIRYEPSAVVRHRHRREMGDLTRQLYDNGRSFGVYLIKLLRDGTVPRTAVAHYAVTTWLPWLVGRLVPSVLGRHPLPPLLIWAELRGAVVSPFAFVSTYRLFRRPGGASALS